MNVPLLTLMTLVPFAGAIVVGCLLAGRGLVARRAALVAHAVVVLLAVRVWAGFDVGAAGMQYGERHAWVPSLGVEYHLGLDGLGLVSVLLAAVLPLFSAVVSGRVARGREGLYHALLLLVQGGLLGTFTALNFFHWFLFWELTLVPAYLLVRLFGGRRAGPASFQFFVYTMVGSVAMLVGFLALRAAGGSFDFLELAEFGRAGGLEEALARELPWAGSGAALGWVVFGGVLLGLAVKAPIWPLHTWLPDTYTEAPAPVTMVMTGVMSKMGVYGLLRLVVPVFPEHWRAVQGGMLALALATVIWPVLAAVVQTDLKRLLAYSSINHVGYCILGISAWGLMGGGVSDVSQVGVPALNGVILQMLNHGLTAATLFACVEILERRTGGLREVPEFGGLRRAAPVFCGLMGISVFASIGLPGLNGFVSEFLIFRGVFAASPWVAAAGTLGLLGTAVFLLTMMQRMFHGPLDAAWAGFQDLTVRERWELGVPVGLMVVLGLYPEAILRVTQRTVLQLAGGN